MPPIPYSIEGLLDWSGFELVVSALADVPPQPSPGEIAAAPAIAPPGARQTAIELPYRLTLSPNHNVAWRHATTPVTYSSRTELWHTRLAAKAADGSVSELSAFNTAPLRAIWSPDYNPARAFDPSQSPKKTDDDDDHLVPKLGVTDISPNDRHQIVILTSAFHGYGDDQNAPYLPTPVDAQMLMLSPLGGWLRSRGHWIPPHALRFAPWPILGFAADLPPIEENIQLAERDAPVEDRAPAQARPLAENKRAADAITPREHTAARLGAVADNRFVKPELARPAIPPFKPAIPIVGDQLDLSEWVHIAAQGRDHYVRIVYEGHLYPFGHRAALIKITERKFQDTALPEGGTTPIAHMVQREYIVVREAEKSYRGQLKGNAEIVAGRKMPLTKVRLTTLVTPDLSQPLPVLKQPLPVPGNTNFSFWIRVGAPAQDFMFHSVGTDISGHEIEFTTPLIFASLTDTGGGFPNLSTIQGVYKASGERRVCAVLKQKMTYAPRNPADDSTDNTTLVTSALYFDTDSYACLFASFGGYMPVLYKAAVHLPAIEQLLGTATNTTIRLYDPYIQNDLDPNAGVFAEIVKEVGGALSPDQMPVTFTADKAGGIATPNLNLSNLSRAHGPLSGSAANAAQDQFNANDFFGGLSGDLEPKLFGAIKLTDLLPIAPGASTATNAPKTQFALEDGGKTIVVKFNWEPEVRQIPGALVSFTPNDNGATALAINGEIRKPVAVPPNPPAPGSFAFTGSLTNFRLDILNAIALHFIAFSFSAGSNKKLDVKVDLDQNKPFEFEGDLAFVQDLSNIIPPGTFGDGPSIDLTPAPGVHVGYAVTLPPAAVGVFSLENIKLSAGLELPLLTGKPLVDFSFAERAHPFLLTVSLLGGGGFLHVQLDTEGMKLLEAAFEFGANASINLGVASGGVHIMAGIYFSMQVESGSTKATLQGYLRMGGELSVLGIISISLEFVLSFTYDSEGKASGRATLTVAVKVLFFSKSVEISVEKRFGGSAGDPTFAQLITSAGVWNTYASAFA